MDYDDIINLPHHQSGVRKHMPIADRAAQFSAFAAISGHDAAIRETARLTDSRIELDDEQADILNRKIGIIRENAADMPEITVTYFLPDEKKDGGKYVRHTGRIRRVDAVYNLLVFADGKEIFIGDVINIEGDFPDEQDFPD
ncbi:MAG: hypothetical protein PUE13_07985 [Clostridiales bacterium]|nr:hypothetical protein [Clostridiales bacterium]